jgi:hypothetical protein
MGNVEHFDYMEHSDYTRGVYAKDADARINTCAQVGRRPQPVHYKAQATRVAAYLQSWMACSHIFRWTMPVCMCYVNIMYVCMYMNASSMQARAREFVHACIRYRCHGRFAPLWRYKGIHVWCACIRRYIHIYVYADIYTYIYMRRYIHIYVYTDIHTYMYMQIQECASDTKPGPCIPLTVHTYIHAYIHTHILAYRIVPWGTVTQQTRAGRRRFAV